MFIRRLIIALALNVIVFGWMFLSIAGTWDWWRAWVFLGVIIAGTLVIMVGVLRHQPDLLNERFKGIFQRGQPPMDRLVMLLFLTGYCVQLIFTPFDANHLHLLAKPGLVVSSLGMVFVVSGYAIVALAFRENTFAIPIIKHQKERRQNVGDTGLYGIVRHPLYLGVSLLLVGMRLWLESDAGALVAILPIAALMLRTVVEEQFLSRELPGYAAYTE